MVNWGILIDNQEDEHPRWYVRLNKKTEEMCLNQSYSEIMLTYSSHAVS